MIYILPQPQPIDTRFVPHGLALGLGFATELSVGKVLQKDCSSLEPGDVLYVVFDDGRMDKMTVIGARVLSLYAKAMKPLEGEFPLKITNLLQGSYRHEPLPWKIHTLGDLSYRTAAELLSIEGFGRKSLSFVQEVLALHGLWLNFKSNWPTFDIDRLDLSERVLNSLRSHNVMKIDDLLTQTKKDVLFATQSESATKEIEEKLATLGFSLTT